MEIESILRALEYNTGRFPRDPLEAAIARREAITPYLLAVVDDAASDIDRVVADEAYMAHLYAFYLLAQFRERRAYPLIVDFFSIPGEVTLDVTGDFVTEDLGRVLASVSGGDLGPMKSLAENAAVNEFVRDAALTGMVCLVVAGITPREEIIAYFRSLFRGGLERTYSFVWASLVSESTSLYPEELLPDIRRAFADGLVDEGYIDLAWIEEILAQGQEAALAYLRESRRYQLIDDTIREMEGWACFDAPPPPEPQKKVGRNDPCPCGSGRKYKHCCMREDR
ncbi:MAG: DUF1186 domain-containing protein [Anaerolineae bacterium]|jgi:hypothetical protein